MVCFAGNLGTNPNSFIEIMEIGKMLLGRSDSTVHCPLSPCCFRWAVAVPAENWLLAQALQRLSTVLSQQLLPCDGTSSRLLTDTAMQAAVPDTV